MYMIRLGSLLAMSSTNIAYITLSQQNYEYDGDDDDDDDADETKKRDEQSKKTVRNALSC